MKLPMPREGQQIDRVIYAFGRRYHACNPKVFNSEEAPYFLGFALVVLNTAMWKKSMAHQLIRKDQFTQQFKNLEDMDQQVTPVYLEVWFLLSSLILF
jgi:Sec7-like guanine-nucleotide exchange factor